MSGGVEDEAEGHVLCRVLHRRRRKLGEVNTRSSAIMNFCRECWGWGGDGDFHAAHAVRGCTNTKCHLWPWRMGKLDPVAFEVPAGVDPEAEV